MPTERFDKLSEQKKARISDAISEGFRHGGTGDVHITQIAKNARISRGSLYTYFSNKEDMLIFSLHQAQRSIWKNNRELLAEKNGDYWEMMKAGLQYHFNVCRTNRLYRLLYLPSERNERVGNLSCRLFRGLEYEEYKSWVYHHLSPSYREWFSEEAFGLYQDTCNDVMTIAIQEYLTGTDTEEEITEVFHKKMKHLKPDVKQPAV